MLELAAKLTQEHLDKAVELLNTGLPEYVVAAKLGIPYGSWKYWKSEARKVRAAVEESLDEVREEGLLAKDGTPLGFAVLGMSGNTIYRAGTKKDALSWINKNGKVTNEEVIKKSSELEYLSDAVVTIEDETEDIKELVEMKTSLDRASIKILTLLEACEKGRAYAIDENLTNVVNAGKSDWKASAWFLERTDRENFGRNETIVHKGGLGLTTVELSKEEEDQYKKNLASVIGGNFNE